MTTQQIADRLVALCRQGQYDEAYQELFAQDAVNVEPAYTQQPEVKGLDNLLKKGKEFMGSVKEVHSNEVSDPLVAGNFFTCAMNLDMTMQDGSRMPMSELCVYETKDGKVIREQFHY